MKKMLKLNELNKQDMNKVNGGDVNGGSGGGSSCGCGCNYANTGGSSSSDNKVANFCHSLFSPGTETSSPK